MKECPDCQGRGVRPAKNRAEEADANAETGDIECPRCDGTGRQNN